MSKRDSSGCGTVIGICLVIGFISSYWHYILGIAILILVVFGLYRYVLYRKENKDYSTYENVRKKNNPKQEGKILSGGRYVGGRDIEPGVYDVFVTSGSGIVKTGNTDTFHEFLSYDTTNEYKNLEVERGTVLLVDTEISIQLYNKREIQTKEETENPKSEQFVDKDFDNLDGHQFEVFCAKVLEKNGYKNVEVTKGSGDQGVDILAERDGIKYAIQCKHYSQPVGNKAIQEIYTGMRFYHCHVGIVMTNNYFTQSAKDLAKENGIVLWDRDYLLNFLSSNVESYNDEANIINDMPFADDEKSEIHNLAETEEKCEESNNMYDKEKGVYPPGVYVVGDDIEIGKYILYAKKGENKDPMVTFYENYSKYRKEEINQIERFEEDYYVSLRENGMVMAVRDAEIRKL